MWDSTRGHCDYRRGGETTYADTRTHRRRVKPVSLGVVLGALLYSFNGTWLPSSATSVFAVSGIIKRDCRFSVCVCKKESATECIWARTRKRERQYVGGTYESERGWVVLTFLLLACSHAHSLSLSLSSTFIIRIFSAYLCVELMNHQHNSPHFLFILIKQSCMFLLQSPVPTYKINGVSHKHIFAFSIALMYTSTSLKDRDWGKRGQK